MDTEGLARRIVAGERVFFLLGAGVSVPAGIPTDKRDGNGLAWQLAVSDTGDVAEAERKFGTRDLALRDLFPTINKSRFRSLLRQQNWVSRQPTTTHDVLARIAREGFQVELATTNYDPLGEKGLKALGAAPDIVCSADTLVHLKQSALVYCKIHGCPYSDRAAENLLVTDDDL